MRVYDGGGMKYNCCIYFRKGGKKLKIYSTAETIEDAINCLQDEIQIDLIKEIEDESGDKSGEDVVDTLIKKMFGGFV